MSNPATSSVSEASTERSSMRDPRVKKQLATVLLALVAVGLCAFGALDRNWYVKSSAEGEFAIGLISAEMCMADTCRVTAISSFSLSTVGPRLGLAVLLVGVFSCFLLFAATGRMLMATPRFSWLPKVSLFAAIFSAILAGVWMFASPWSQNMVPGFAAIAFFIGAALCAATAAVPLGALRRA